MAKPGPKKSVKSADRARMRAITASDTEWAWVVAEAKRLGTSASGLVRQMIQKAMTAKP